MADSGIQDLADDLIRLQALNGDPLSWGTYYLRRDPYDLRRLIYEHIQSCKWTLSLVPMGHLKSTTVPETLAAMLPCQYPAIRIGVVGEAEERPLRISNYARQQLEGNPRIIQDYGPLRGDHWTQRSWTRANRPPGPHLSHPTCKAVGLHSRLLGSRWDVILADDLVSMENSQTEHQRQKTTRWWTAQVLSRLDANVTQPWPWGGYHVVGNLHHPRDTYNHMIETAKAAGVSKHELLAVLQLAAFTDEDRTQPLLPDLWTVEALEQQRFIMGSTGFELAYMNNPGGMENNPFPEESFAYWTQDPTRVLSARVNPVYKLPPRRELYVRTGWDFGGESQGNDYTACAVCGVHRRTGRYYWLQFLYGNWPTSELIEKFLLVMTKWRPREQMVEANGFQLRLAQEIARSHPELMRTIVPTRTGSELSKDARIMAGLEPAFTARRHVFPEPEGDPVVAEVLQMIQHFPGHRYKDVLDAMEIAGRELGKRLPPRRAKRSLRITPPQ